MKDKESRSNASGARIKKTRRREADLAMTRSDGGPLNTPTTEKRQAAAKRTVGRPTQLTRALVERVCRYVRGGNYVETAAAACGVAKQTLYNWMRVARDARAKMEATSSE